MSTSPRASIPTPSSTLLPTSSLAPIPASHGQEINENPSDLKRCCQLCPVLRNKRAIQAHRNDRKGCPIYKKMQAGLIGNIQYNTETLGRYEPASDDESDYDSDTMAGSNAPQLSPTTKINAGPLQIACLLELLEAAEEQVTELTNKTKKQAAQARRKANEIKQHETEKCHLKTKVEELTKEHHEVNSRRHKLAYAITRITLVFEPPRGGNGTTNDASLKWRSKAPAVSSEGLYDSGYPGCTKLLCIALADRETLLTDEITRLHGCVTTREAELRNHQIKQAELTAELARIVSARNDMVFVTNILGTKLAKSQEDQAETVRKLECLTEKRDALDVERQKLTSELSLAHQDLSVKIDMVERLTAERNKSIIDNAALQGTIHDEEQKCHTLANDLQTLRSQLDDLASSQKQAHEDMRDMRQAALLNWVEAKDLVQTLVEDGRAEAPLGDRVDLCQGSHLRGLQDYVAEMVDNHSRAVIEDRKRERAERASGSLAEDGDRARKRRRLAV